MGFRSAIATALLAGGCFGLVSVNDASAGSTYTVAGTSNPFLSGMPSGSTCCMGDSAPGESPVYAGSAAAGEVFTFTNVTGAVNFGPSFPLTGPDGDNSVLVDTPFYEGGLTTINNIAGYYSAPADALIGVFLGPGLPTGNPAPGLLNYGTSGLGTIVGTNFTTLSPELQQIFFIGDGLTGTGTGSIQTYVAPAGATRLFLGTVDGFGWNNNGGSFSVTVNSSVPEPSTWAMMALGFVGLVFLGYRNSHALAARV
jgi:hypothetical protein